MKALITIKPNKKIVTYKIDDCLEENNSLNIQALENF